MTNKHRQVSLITQMLRAATASVNCKEADAFQGGSKSCAIVCVICEACVSEGDDVEEKYIR
jgi:hypothetical protein